MTAAQRVLVTAVLALVRLVQPSIALACVPPDLCRGYVVYPLGPRFPASASAAEWYGHDRSPAVDPSTLILERWAGGSWERVESAVTQIPLYGLRIAPLAGFAIGERYRIPTPVAACAPSSSMPREFVAADIAPIGAALGTLRATAPTEELLFPPEPFNGCAEPALGMTVNVSLDLATSTRDWDSMLVLEARVDGEAFVGLPGSAGLRQPIPVGYTRAGRGSVQLATLCAPYVDPGGTAHPFDPSVGLAEGAHVVQFRGRVAGTATVLESETLTVTLRCAAVVRDAGGLTDAAADASAPSDAPATVATDVTGDRGGTGGSGGCGCGVRPSPARGTSSWLLALLCVLGFASSRSRKRQESVGRPAAS